MSERIYARSMRCQFCGLSLYKYGPDEPWFTAKVGTLGDDAECAAAPNPGDGPMPGHKPGTPVVRNPMWEPALTEWSQAAITFLEEAIRILRGGVDDAVPKLSAAMACLLAETGNGPEDRDLLELAAEIRDTN
jgi:hypothetical protein